MFGRLPVSMFNVVVLATLAATSPLIDPVLAVGKHYSIFIVFSRLQELGHAIWPTKNLSFAKSWPHTN